MFWSILIYFYIFDNKLGLLVLKASNNIIYSLGANSNFDMSVLYDSPIFAEGAEVAHLIKYCFLR